MARLRDKVAIVTGAGGGIGGATVERFLAEGANVVASDFSANELQALQDRVGTSENLLFKPADVSNEDDVKALVSAAVDAFGRVDVLFANAGTEGHAKTLEQLSMDEFRRVIDTNVIGVWLCMKHCVAPMKAAGGGSMIATASVAGLIGFGNLMHYSASKHAVCGMVQTAALELGPLGIRVNGIAPGPIDNRMIQSLESQLSPDDPGVVREGITHSVALGRYGKNEEVANLALFLASEESSYTHGAIYTIDGGYTAA